MSDTLKSLLAALTAAVVVFFGYFGYEVAVTPPELAPQTPNPVTAFPGAYGTGRFTMNRCVQNALADPGRVHIFRVSNLNGNWNATPHVVGSWYAALDSAVSKPPGDLKFIVADTSGLIQLFGHGESTQYELDCTWIAGQTAPGGGLTFWSGTGARTGFSGGSNDVVVEYFRVRNARANMFGLLGGTVNDSTGPAIINHVSICYSRHTGSGGGQMVVAVAEYGREVTVQNSFLCSPDASHPSIIYCQGSHWAQVMRDCTIARNYIAGETPAYRCPLVHGNRTYVVSNVIHGCTRPVRTSNGGTVDIVANFSKVRPGRAGFNAKWTFEDNCADDDLGLPGPDSYLDCPRSIYIDRNRTDQNGFDASTPADSMYIGSKQSITASDIAQQSHNWPTVTFDGDTVPEEWRRDAPLTENYGIYPVPDMTDSFRDDSVVAMAGVMRLLACDGTWRTGSPGGTWTAVRDSIDRQHVTWFYNALAETPPYIPHVAWDQSAGVAIPEPPAAPKCADTDSDALPDAWEERWAGDPTSIDPKIDSDGDGLLNFVEYLHDHDPFTFTNF